jgi:hypothetical protein
MSYAANPGRDRIIEMLHAMGATDHIPALIRAELQGQIPTARLLHKLMGSPVLADGRMFLRDPAYTLSASGTALVFELRAQVKDEYGRAAPVDVVLETDSRKPEAKHAILQMYVEHGVELPDTPVMALHRGRIDLLEKLLRRDPDLLSAVAHSIRGDVTHRRTEHLCGSPSESTLVRKALFFRPC